ncbi:hypothetical protein [Pedobacter alpinus]|uniref:Uncharacterized protein n=1 Tax=Pedobacter alpinus TaxID=1590643 RepID=A0ABW5TQW7_9SPHI
MIETLTPTLNSIVNNDEETKNTNMLSVEEFEFYENLKPALDLIVKAPSNETVNRILEFSKSS